DALPRPDATSWQTANLWGDVARTRYLNNASKLAYERYKAKLAGEKGLPGDDKDADENLILVNVEAVDARWDDNLAGVWSKIKSSLGSDNKQTVRPRSHWDTPPKEKEAGWVVEIRGSTNHETAPAFLVETLVENLASIGIKAAPAAAAPAPAD